MEKFTESYFVDESTQSISDEILSILANIPYNGCVELPINYATNISQAVASANRVLKKFGLLEIDGKAFKTRLTIDGKGVEVHRINNILTKD